ncbi:toxin [Candidatus Endobugula sertula]|uniref:Toxin n=1 Tax=Candidatus Endobugula sertula TaxID=62101 RepID=A0A1D2QSR6_9GAMM|nr:toxin [Candidatus Endobugula sertula]
MSDTLEARLQEDLRDALVDFYLGQIVPNDPGMEPYRQRIENIDELYDFLLLDTQVSYKVQTAGVASATKSIQQYINRILLNLEPGLSMTFEEKYNWLEFANRYGYWAANQQLRIYPEIYVDPSLRLGKTEFFFQLESALNQGKLSDESVQEAVLGYLNNFEDVSNLKVLTGYENGIDINNDKIFFVARTRSQPYQYYWRSLDMSQGQSALLELYSSAWDEWRSIDLPLESVEEGTVRPIYMSNRLYISWVEVAEEKDDAGEITGYMVKINIAHRKYDGSWSTPNTLREGLIEPWVGRIDRMIAVMDTTRAEDRLALVAYRRRKGHDEKEGDYDYDEVFTYVCDTLLTESTDLPPSENDDYSDMDYYGAGIVWFYTRDPGNRGKDDDYIDLYQPDDIDKQYKELILYPLTTNTDWLIADAPVHGGGTVGENSISQKVKFIEGSINDLSITATSDYQHDFLKDGYDYQYILFCIWIENAGNLCYLDYVAYDASSYPSDGIKLETQCHLQPDWGNITIQSGFSFPVELAGDDPGARLTQKYSVGNKLRPLLQLKQNEQVEYLQFPEYDPKLGDDNVLDNEDVDDTIRLNTLFAKELISRANESIDKVLSWETQNITELPIHPGGKPEPIDLDGANGIYFWELFFHMPFLVSWRLNIEQRYEEANTWLYYLFDPNEEDDNPDLAAGKPRYWNSRPLLDKPEDTGASSLLEPSDPDAIAESEPIHYRKAIFNFYVRNVIDQADMEYRQLTPTSLILARLTYATASALLGPRPDIQLATTWEPILLKDAVLDTDSGVRSLEMQTEALPLLPVTHDSAITTQDNGLFLDPINMELTILWDDLEQRLYNLRHNLSIDGKELPTQLYDTPIDPRDLQSQRYQRMVATRNAGAMKLVVPHYRFQPMLSRAMTGVETLIQFGSTLLSLLERKDSLSYESFQMNQQLSLYNFTISLQQQAIDISEAELEVQELNLSAAQQRRDHYKSLYDEDVSQTEQEVIELQSCAASAIISAQASRTAAAVADLAPNVFGLATGGMNWGAPLNAIAETITIDYHSSSTKAESLSVSESYRRRRQDWEIQYKQAQSDIDSINKQIERQQRQVQADNTRLDQIQAEYEKSQILLEYFSARFTNESLYTWMISQLSSLYLQAYDSVMSVCLATESAWQYELGQFDTHFVQTGCWNDLYQGLLVGETLKLCLLQMDQAFTDKNARRLEITKTVSLKDTLSDWEAKLETLKTSGSIHFGLSETDHFVSDYTSAADRRIKSVGVSLPMLVGPYQDVCATLTQNFSLLSVSSLRTARQQVALSSGTDDSGMFTLNFDDERFLPFEGTGVESDWTLEFNNLTDERRQEMLDSLTDVILHIRYTARAT